MYRSIDDFLETWESEREFTLKLFSAMSDASLSQQVTPDGRSLGRIGWHIVCTIPEMMTAIGVPVEGPADSAPVPARSSELAAAFDQAARAVTEGLRASWTDDTLLAERDMYGEKWKNGFTLEVLLRHQVHHRGQMTVLIRQAGLPVPGIYGPSREEWAAYGRPAAE
ncbi:MAG: DinB family protein [Ignavibacteria bacterium]|nr:DinB family protein [Ignavibacteria bacterium]